MRLGKKMLNRIIKEEMKLLKEGCGCGCNGKPGGCGGNIESLGSYIDEDDIAYDDISSLEIDDPDLHDYENNTELTTGSEFLTKDEALKAVVAIAMSTSCPVTSESLLSTVRDLMN